MDKTFMQANYTLAWLGTGTTETDFSMDCLSDFKTLMAALVDSSHTMNMDKIKDWFTKYDPVASILEEIWHRPYWSRLWVVQELFLAPCVYLICGRRIIDLRQIEGVLKGVAWKAAWPSWLEQTPWLHSNFFGACKKMLAYRHRVITHRLFMPMVLYYAAFECRDLHDKIYGLLGLARKDERDEIIIDYTKPPAYAFWQAFAAAEIGTWVVTGREELRALGIVLGVKGDEWHEVGPAALARFKDVFGEHDPCSVFQEARSYGQPNGFRPRKINKSDG